MKQAYGDGDDSAERAKQDGNKSSPEMLPESPLIHHFAELRRRLLWAGVGISVAFFLCFSFSFHIITALLWPLRKVLGDSYVPGFKEVTEPFLVSLSVSLLSSVVLSAPWWLYQVWRFIEPALYSREKVRSLRFCGVSWLLFWLGAMFCFWVILPITLRFLVTWGDGFAAVDLTVQSYMSFVSRLILGFGIIFQLPVVLFVLSILGLVCGRDLKKARRYVVLACFVVSALLTPPDWISQVGMAVPLYVLYEGALWTVVWRERGDRGGKSGKSRSTNKQNWGRSSR